MHPISLPKTPWLSPGDEPSAECRRGAEPLALESGGRDTNECLFPNQSFLLGCLFLVSEVCGKSDHRFLSKTSHGGTPPPPSFWFGLAVTFFSRCLASFWHPWAKLHSRSSVVLKDSFFGALGLSEAPFGKPLGTNKIDFEGPWPNLGSILVAFWGLSGSRFWGPLVPQRRHGSISGTIMWAKWEPSGNQNASHQNQA